MIKNYIRSTIIVLIQCILPIVIVLSVSPWLIDQSTKLKDWQTFLHHNHIIFLMAHLVFYITLIGFWPTLVSALKSDETNQQQRCLALQARWYLVTVFLFIEVLLFI